MLARRLLSYGIGQKVGEHHDKPHEGLVLILTPTGRDAEAAAALLSKEAIDSHTHLTLDSLLVALDDTTGCVLLADEALLHADLSVLAEYLAAQPPWSDLPFIVLTQAGIVARRQVAELNLHDKLGNVLFLERPLSALTFISAIKSTLRARQRQWQVKDYLAEQVEAAERAAAVLERRVQERTEELAAAEHERQKIAEVLAQSRKMEAVGQLTGGLAHDLNNMLAGITGGLDLLQTRVTQGRIDQLDRFITMARKGAKRATLLTQRLLAFSRRQTLDPKPTSINNLVTGLMDLIRTTVGPAVTVDTVLRAELWPTLCDPHQLENALLNLCANARDAMPEGGLLTIRTGNVHLNPTDAAILPEAKSGEYVTLCVTDTGCGMPPDVVARAFEPFFTTKPLGQGTGLGLSMIYGFVQQSGGHIQINSAVDHGTTVTLYLPRHRGPAAIDDGESKPATIESVTAHKTVLVVDDELPVRMLVSEVLTELGHKVCEAADGPSGLSIVRSGTQIDLLVTDVGMPGGMNGRQLADAARAHQPGLKVLFITGYAAAALSRATLLEPGMEVMTKPFAVADFTTKVNAMLADHTLKEAE